jgi:hypothetical protein
MNMNPDQLVQEIKNRFDHATQKKLLKEKYQSKMTFAYQGGMFCAGPELLTLLQSVPVEDNVVIVDLYENPVRINPLDLQHIAFERWQEQMTAWAVEYEKLSQQR